MDKAAKNRPVITVTPRPSARAGLRELAHVAWQLHQHRLWPQAEAIFRYVIAEDPTYARAVNNLSVVRGCLNEVAEAEQLSRRAIALEPDNPSYRSNLATTLLDLTGDTPRVLRQGQGVVDF